MLLLRPSSRHVRARHSRLATMAMQQEFCASKDVAVISDTKRRHCVYLSPVTCRLGRTPKRELKWRSIHCGIDALVVAPNLERSSGGHSPCRLDGCVGVQMHGRHQQRRRAIHVQNTRLILLHGQSPTNRLGRNSTPISGEFQQKICPYRAFIFAKPSPSGCNGDQWRTSFRPRAS